ncbi:enoyl-CoA hydratase/isomerase family protein [Vineibacter terrae]|uniref:enoyl-CoA hydratase/isomerase family protein n=1 Tax=Vineibacter terrae TaxID=2586908 RepID=UPI002E32E5DB|nr:enoyl-CoA hydratase/isomerase family protein [Vineibacter terrae]HEX2890637.1 enoyl-CoA hydratase/isomerase family protein [Vineibacter terrae]
MSFTDGATPQAILCEQDGPVGIIMLNRPQAMNTISRQLEAELHEALDRAERDPSVRAIVLAGAGGRAFSAGYDLSAQHDLETRADVLRHWWAIDTATPDKHWHLLRLEKPVIAAVDGWCLAGGFWYALAADITIASERAVFGQPEVRETQNSTVLLGWLAGWKNAARYALTGDHFDAHEARRMGIVNDVVPHEEVLAHAIALGKRIALVPADSVRINKRITTFALEAMGLRTAMSGASFLSSIVHASADTPELAELHEVRRSQGLAASLKLRDDKFRPEPGGPRARPRP